MNNNTDLQKARALSDQFAVLEGRRPRILLAEILHGEHEPKTKSLALTYADLGFDVDISPIGQTVGDIVKQAIENDVHVLNISQVANEQEAIHQINTALNTHERAAFILVVNGLVVVEGVGYNTKTDTETNFETSTKTAKVAVQILQLLIGT